MTTCFGKSCSFGFPCVSFVKVYCMYASFTLCFGGWNVGFLHMYRLNKTESAIFISLICLLLPEDLHSAYFIFTVAGVVPCGGRKTSPCTSS